MTDTLMYSDATVELVAKALWDKAVNGQPVGSPTPQCFEDARAALDVLFAAGQLLPSGGAKRTEHEIEWRPITQTRGGVGQVTYWDLDNDGLTKEVEAAAKLGMKMVSHRWREVRTWGEAAYTSDGPRFVGAWVEAGDAGVRRCVSEGANPMTDPTRDTVYGIRPHLYPRSEAEDQLARKLAESMPINPRVLAEFGIEPCCVEFAETGLSHTEACRERADAEPGA